MKSLKWKIQLKHSLQLLQKIVCLKKSMVCHDTYTRRKLRRWVIRSCMYMCIFCTQHTEISQPLIVNTLVTAPVQVDPDYLDMEENEKVKAFVMKGCGCELTSGKPCSIQLNFEHFLSFRSQCKELTKAELDMTILGQLNAFTFSGEEKANDTTHRHSSDGRQREYTLYWHRGYRVCRTTFTFLHSISEKRLKNLKCSLRIHGLTPRNHGNSKRLPANTINFADTQAVVHCLCRNTFNSIAWTNTWI